MAFKKTVFTLLGSLIFLTTFAQTKQMRLEYIEQYKSLAMKEMKRVGIPASIKLAQAVLESGAGTSSLALKAHNHFGMKCGSEWHGDTYYLKDDDFNEDGKLIESCFRVFPDDEASFVAHSEFLRDPNKAYRYGFLFRIDPKDYKKWAQGLKTAGYATNADYGDLLISLIDEYKLSRYDSGGGDEAMVMLINEVKMIVAHEGETPADIAARYKLRPRCVLKFNEKLRGENQPLEESTHIYIQKKRRFFREKQRWHYVKSGETMYDIAQNYGVRLFQLYRKNRMDEGTEPAIGQKISLRGRVPKGATPKLRSKKEELDDEFLDNPKPNKNNNNSNTGNSNSTNSNAGNSNSTNSNTGNSNSTNSNTGNSNSTSGQPPRGTIPAPNPNDPPLTVPPIILPPDDPTPTTVEEPSTAPRPTTKPTTTKPTTTKPKPTTKPTPPVVTKPTPTPPPSANTEYYTVQAKETLYSLSRRFGLSVDALKKLNNLTDNNIRVGQVLRVK